jgi:hypothetical protein
MIFWNDLNKLIMLLALKAFLLGHALLHCHTLASMILVAVRVYKAISCIPTAFLGAFTDEGNTAIPNALVRGG